MKKRIVLGLTAAGTAIALLPLLAAFEAHVINVTAHIENALNIQRDEIPFGTVFPEEHIFSEPFDISLSRSFLEQRRLDDVTYVIKQKPKCERNSPTGEGPLHKPVDPITHQCPEGYHVMPLLCPYLSKEKDKEDKSLLTDLPPYDTELAALHGDPDAWNPEDPAIQAKGKLTQAGNDIVDNWVIDLLVPCFEGQCAQDGVIPPKYWLPCEDVNQDGQCDLNGATFGCDLWVEVNGYSLPPTTTEPGTITVTKIIDPAGATTVAIGDFDLFVGLESVVSGIGESFAAGVYAISETDTTAVPYTSVLGGDADCSDGSVTVDPGESISCTITNEIPECSDGLDNDSDGGIDSADAAGCGEGSDYDPTDDSEFDISEE